MQPVKSFFVGRGKVMPVAAFDPGAESSGVTIYEVLKVAEGVPLFLEDHLDRFRQSVRVKFGEYAIKDEEIIKAIHELIVVNDLYYGNIRFTYTLNANGGQFQAYVIPHHYPSVGDYRFGVSVTTLHLERPNPNVKLQINEYKDKVNNIIQSSKVYEVLLVDGNGQITEGSRSNFFYIVRDMLFTAPSSVVLEGISRKVLLRLIEKHQIPFSFSTLPVSKIGTVQAAFLTGTSPGVLPVANIEGHILNPSSALITELMILFNNEVKHYINTHK